MSIEQQASQAITQQGTKVRIGNDEYFLPKPTVATIIMASEIISTLPEVDENGSENVLQEILHIAKDTKPLGRLLAVFILGAEKVIKEEKKTQEKGARWTFWKRKHINEVDKLADKMLNTLSPQEMSNIISECLGTLQIGVFFALTTSLTKSNVLKRTKGGVVR